MKFLHDIDARQDEKIRRILHLHGMRGYGSFWVLVETLRKNNGELDTKSEHFWPLLAEELRCEESAAKQFVNDCIRIGVFREENGALISDRCKRDLVAYQSRVASAKNAASIRWSPGPKIADTYTALLTQPKCSRAEFDAALSGIGCNAQDTERLWRLSKEFSKQALGHYARSASAHLRANGAQKADFVSYLEKWLLDDRAQQRGYFATKGRQHA